MGQNFHKKFFQTLTKALNVWITINKPQINEKVKLYIRLVLYLKKSFSFKSS